MTYSIHSLQPFKATLLLLIAPLLSTPLFSQDMESFISLTVVEPVEISSEAIVLPEEVPDTRAIEYPESAFNDGTEGNVRLNVLFDENGSILETEVLDNGGDTRLLHAAVEGLQGTSFTPGTIDGEAKEMWAEIEIRFLKLPSFPMTPHSPQGSEVKDAKPSADTTTPMKSSSPFPEFIADGEPAEFDKKELQSHLIYPEEALKNGIEGIVIVKVYLSKEGSVKKVSIVSRKGVDSDIFDQAAIDAVKATTFSPAIQNGYPVPFKLSFPISFKIQ